MVFSPVGLHHSDILLHFWGGLWGFRHLAEEVPLSTGLLAFFGGKATWWLIPRIVQVGYNPGDFNGMAMWGQVVHKHNWGELTHLNDPWDQPRSTGANPKFHKNQGWQVGDFIWKRERWAAEPLSRWAENFRCEHPFWNPDCRRMNLRRMVKNG